MRLTERYMDPPGQSMPDCLIAARLANNMERVLREMGDAAHADKFKGFDWKTEEDAFMDGYHKHEKGGEFVTYARLRAMGNNGFQEPATLNRRRRGFRRQFGKRDDHRGPARHGRRRTSDRGKPAGRNPSSRPVPTRPPHRFRTKAANGSSAPSVSTPTASSTPRTARPPSKLPNGAACRLPASRSRRTSTGS
jgi:hypothetical protein